MAYCVPIKDMKDTANFTKMVQESTHPIFVTKNGREEFVVMSTEVFQNSGNDLGENGLRNADLSGDNLNNNLSNNLNNNLSNNLSDSNLDDDDLLRRSLYNMINKSLADIDAGRTVDAKEFLNSVKEKYGL